MKKPKIAIDTYNVPLPANPERILAHIRVDGLVVALSTGEHTCRRAARDWAKEWCRVVGAALMEKGK